MGRTRPAASALLRGRASRVQREQPYFGWLSTELPLYQPSTLSLKARVHTQPVGQRPFIEVEPTDHPLAVEQRTGITLARVQEIAEALLHALPAPRSRQGLPPGDLHTQKRMTGAQTRTARPERDSCASLEAPAPAVPLDGR
jgi:hypothetical protein